MDLKNKVCWFLGSSIIGLLILRIYLWVFPFSNFNFGSYNIHHLYIGAFLLIIVLVLFLFNIVNNFSIILAGLSTSLVLDEIIYLIFTDGSDLAYLTGVSFFGMIISTISIFIFVLILYFIKRE